TKGEEIDARTRYRQARSERIFKTFFLDKTNLSLEEKEFVKEKIFIGFNTSMFKGLIKQIDEGN
ncbi:hypothetical protein, partial [Pedobacter alpinus]|uniref:hypothetical protein n=1 Tax=Pedobacter alpinus TaxID=1590643 RepID=UPI0036070F76